MPTWQVQLSLFTPALPSKEPRLGSDSHPAPSGPTWTASVDKARGASAPSSSHDFHPSMPLLCSSPLMGCQLCTRKGLPTLKVKVKRSFMKKANAVEEAYSSKHASFPLFLTCLDGDFALQFYHVLRTLESHASLYCRDFSMHAS